MRLLIFPLAVLTACGQGANSPDGTADETDALIESDSDTDTTPPVDLSCDTPTQVCEGDDCVLDLAAHTVRLHGRYTVDGVPLDSDEAVRVLYSTMPHPHHGLVGSRYSFTATDGDYAIDMAPHVYDFYAYWGDHTPGDTQGRILIAAGVEVSRDTTLDVAVTSVAVPMTLTADGSPLAGTLHGRNDDSFWSAPVGDVVHVPAGTWDLTVVSDSGDFLGALPIASGWEAREQPLVVDVPTLPVAVDVRLGGTPLTAGRLIRYREAHDTSYTNSRLPDDFETVRFAPGRYALDIQLASDDPVAGWMHLAAALDPQATTSLTLDVPTATVSGTIDYDDAPLPGARNAFLIFKEQGREYAEAVVSLPEDGQYTGLVPHGTYDVFARIRYTGVDRPIESDVPVASDLTIGGDTVLDVDIDVATLSGTVLNAGEPFADEGSGTPYTVYLTDTSTGVVFSTRATRGEPYAAHVPPGRYDAAVYVHPVHDFATVSARQPVAEDVDVTGDAVLDIDLPVRSVQTRLTLDGLPVPDDYSYSLPYRRFDLPGEPTSGSVDVDTSGKMAIYPGRYQLYANLRSPGESGADVWNYWVVHPCVEIR